MVSPRIKLSSPSDLIVSDEGCRQSRQIRSRDRRRVSKRRSRTSPSACQVRRNSASAGDNHRCFARLAPYVAPGRLPGSRVNSACGRARGQDRRRYRHDSPPFGDDSDPDRLPSPRRGGGSTRGGILGDRPQPRRPAQPRAIAALTRVDRVDILAGSAPISRGIAASSGERGGILHGSSGWRRRATGQ